MEGGAFESTPEAKEYRLLIHREIEGCEKKDGLTRVYIHPSSINFAEREYPFPIMLYVGIVITGMCLFGYIFSILYPTHG